MLIQFGGVHSPEQQEQQSLVLPPDEAHAVCCASLLLDCECGGRWMAMVVLWGKS